LSIREAALSSASGAPCAQGIIETTMIGRRMIARQTRECGPIDLFGFLTTQPNQLVAPMYAKAMPVIQICAADGNRVRWRRMSPKGYEQR
jgi:putative SOS response-associated peptidase YedK